MGSAGAGSRHSRKLSLLYSAFKPICLISFEFSATSFRMNAANCSGVVVCGSRPCWFSAVFISATLATSLMALFSREITSFGVPAGAADHTSRSDRSRARLTH